MGGGRDGQRKLSDFWRGGRGSSPTQPSGARGPVHAAGARAEMYHTASSGGGGGRMKAGSATSKSSGSTSPPPRIAGRGGSGTREGTSTIDALQHVWLFDAERPEWAGVRRILSTEQVDTPVGVESTLRMLLHAMGMDSGADLQVLVYYLQHYADEVLCREVLPWMAGLVVDSARHLRGILPLKILKAGATGCLECSEFHAVVLLAQCFFCVVPKRFHATALRRPPSDSSNRFGGAFRGALKESNFLRLYAASPLELKSKQQLEKLRCFGQYFVASYRKFAPAAGGSPAAASRLMISRVCARGVPPTSVFKTSDLPLAPVTVCDDGAIEAAEGMLQVDFANANIGGGVLGSGCVQEEIRVAVTPAILVARLICEEMAPAENVKITGARQFSTYSGYRESFAFTGPHDDPSPLSHVGFAKIAITAADALNYHGSRLRPRHQYEEPYKIHELFKAYISFKEHHPHEQRTGYVPKTVATGKWGCGAFGGDVELKFAIQLVAASAAGCRGVLFHTYHDPGYAASIHAFMDSLQALQPRVTVARLYHALLHAGGNSSVFAQILTQLDPVRHPGPTSTTSSASWVVVDAVGAGVAASAAVDLDSQVTASSGPVDHGSIFDGYGSKDTL